MTHKLLHLGIIALFLLVASPHAQERAAGSALETQMTWTALSAQAKSASDKADAVNSLVQQSIVCARKGKLYAPGTGPGVDSQGCVESASTGGVSMTTVVNTLSTLTTNLSTNTTTINSILNCNRSGTTFNGSGCVAPTVKTPNCRLEVVNSGSQGGKDNRGPKPCPSGYQVTGANGGSTSDYNFCSRIVCQ